MKKLACTLFAASAFFAAQALAQTTHSVYLDTDADSTTGCTIATPAGTIAGVEVVISATVENSPPQIVSVTRATCEGGTFSAPQAQASTYTVSLNEGTGGADMLEFSSELAGLGAGGPVTAFFVSSNGSGQSNLVQAVIQLPRDSEQPPQIPVPVPTTGWLALMLIACAMLWLVRKYPKATPTLALALLVSVASGPWATRLLAAPLFDWTGQTPLPIGSSGNPNGGDERIGIVAIYAAVNQTQLLLRFDIQDLQATPNQAPTLSGASFSLLDTSAKNDVIGAASGVDADADQTLTYAITAGNANGAFAIDASTGVLTIADRSLLSFDSANSIALTVSVTDDGTPALSASAVFTINLLKANQTPSLNGASFTLLDTSANNDVLGSATGSDADAEQTLTYAITAGNANGAFAIDASSGLLRLVDRTQLSFQEASTIELTVSVTDNGTPPRSASAQFSIHLLKANQAPSLDAASFSLLDTSANNDVLGTAQGVDADTDQTLTYAITGGNANGAFAIDASTGVLRLVDRSQLSFATASSILLTVTVTDDGTPARSASATFTVHLAKANLAPTLDGASFSLLDTSANNDVIGTVQGVDADTDQTLTYAITAGNANGAFAIDASTGELTVADRDQLSFQATNTVQLTVSVTDNGTPARSGSAVFTIELLKANQFPSLNGASYFLLDTSANNDVLGTAVGTDADTDQTLTYAITAGNANGAFAIDANTGVLTVADRDQLSFQAASTVLLTIAVTDNGTPARSASAVFTIELLKANQFPSLSGDSYSLLDTSANNDVLGTAVGTDADTDQTLTYAITAGNANGAFAIDANTGVLSLVGRELLSFQEASTVQLTVSVTDNGTPARSASAVFSIQLVKANQTPILNSANFFLLETSTDDTFIGMANGADADAEQTLTYAITDGNASGAFFIHPQTGALFVANRSQLDFFTTTTVPLTISVTDNGLPPRSASALFIVNLIKINHAPSFTKGADQTVDMNAGPMVVTGWATNISDNDQNTQTLTFNTTNNNNALFALQPSVGANGDLHFTPATDTFGAATVTVVLVDNGGTLNGGVDTSAIQTFTINVAPLFAVALDDSAELEQDAEATEILVLANDLNPYIDTANHPLIIENVTQPEHGEVQITGAGTGLTYQPDSGFTGTDTFTYELEGGSTASVTVTVTEASTANDVGAFNLSGTCGTLGVLGPGFTLTASPTQPLPVGTTITINGSGVANIGAFSVTGGLATVTVANPTSRQIVLTAPLAAGATIAFRTTLSITVAFTLNGTVSLPTDYVATGAKTAGAVSSTLVLCSAS